MFDLALSSAGASIAEVTSTDINYPPENIIDGTNETFWTTTGLYPQHFVVSFTSPVLVETVEIKSANIKELQVHRSVQTTPVDFEKIIEKDLDHVEGQQQTEEFQPPENTTAQHLKFIIKSGHDHFAAVYRVRVNGRAVHQ